MKTLAAVPIAVVLFSSTPFAASPPDRINFQGVLRNASDAPLAGTFDMVFDFYSAPTGGDEILRDLHTAALGGAVTVTGGLLGVELGTGFLLDGSGPGTYATVSPVFRDYADVWVQVQVAGETLSPRIRVVSTPHALNAGSADRLDGIDSSAFSLNTHAHSTLSTGTGLAVANYDGSAAATFSVLYGTSVGTSVQGNQTMTLLAGNGLTGGVSGDPIGDGVSATLHVGGGNGIAVAADGLSLGTLAADWNQWGGFDIVLGSSSSELKIMDSSGGAYYATLDVGALAGDRTFTLGGVGGLIWTQGNDGPGSLLDSDYLDGFTSGQFLRSDTSDEFTAGTLSISTGATLLVEGNLDVGTLTAGDDDLIRFKDGTETFGWTQLNDRFAATDELYVGDDLVVGGTILAGIVDATPLSYNSFRLTSAAGNAPVSGAMNNPGDLFVQWDLELRGKAHFVGGLSDSHSGAIQGWGGEGLRILGVSYASDPAYDSEIQLHAAGPHVRFAADTDADNNQSTCFIWLNNGTYDAVPGGDRVMDLSYSGALRIKGALTSSYGFDLAENFERGEPLEPGDLVASDSGAPTRVRKATAGDGGVVIGVVSEAPGMVLGGGPLDEGSLAAVAGEEIAARYRAERDTLLPDVLAADNGLAERKLALDANANRVRLPLDANGEDPSVAWRGAVVTWESDLESELLRLFFERHNVPIALAGRVPVKVDAEGVPIRPGDPIAAGPIPGVARRATVAGPIVGTALEGLDSGRGKVLALVHGGFWSPAEPAISSDAAALAADLAARTPDPQTGRQALAGHLQVALDSDADEESRFSIFRNGESEIPGELVRVDEQGNVWAKGAFRPSSLDVAEFHPFAGAVEPGDLLVADRKRPGMLRRSDRAEDPAVVGIVSGDPGVLLGGSLLRIAAVDPGLASEMEAARARGDSEEEARIWQRLEAKFRSGHAPIALVGTVSCKVDAAFGPIEVGSLLVSSPTPGHAMRSDSPSPGTVIGKALEPLEAGSGVIRVLVMMR